MNTFARMLLVLALPFALANCGKTEDQKAQDRAQSAIEEYNGLVDQLNGPSPSARWSDDELNAYEAKVNRVEALANQLRAQNGNNGVRIRNLDSGKGIQACRSLLSIARVTKTLITASQKAQAASDSATKIVEDQKIAELNEALVVVKAHKPVKDSSDQEIAELEAALNKADSLESDIVELRKRRRSAEIFPSNATVTVALKEEIAEVRSQRLIEKSNAQRLADLRQIEKELTETPAPSGMVVWASEKQAYVAKLDALQSRVTKALNAAITNDGEISREIKALSLDLTEKIKNARAEFAP